MTDSPIPLSLLRRMADPVLREFMDRLEAQLTRLEYRVTKLEHKVAHLQESLQAAPPDITYCACGENTLTTKESVIWQYHGSRVHTVDRCGKKCEHINFVREGDCPECNAETVF